MADNMEPKSGEFSQPKFQYSWLGEWRIPQVFEPQYGYRQMEMFKQIMEMHHQLFPDSPQCDWVADPGGDMITCAHGYRIFKHVIARGAGLNRN